MICLYVSLCTCCFAVDLCPCAVCVQAKYPQFHNRLFATKQFIRSTKFKSTKTPESEISFVSSFKNAMSDLVKQQAGIITPVMSFVMSFASRFWA